MPTSTDVLLVCPTHGSDPVPFEIDGTKFCSRCLAHYLKRFLWGKVHVMEMRQVEKTYGGEPTEVPPAGTKKV